MPMTNSEKSDLVDDLESTIHQWYAEAGAYDGIQSLSSVIRRKLEPLFTDLTAPEKEEPQEGEWKLSFSDSYVHNRNPQIQPTHGYIYISHAPGCGGPVICSFTQHATPATRRMMEKAKESYEGDKWLIEISERQNGGIVEIPHDSTIFKDAQRRVNYIQTGEGEE